MEQRRLHKTLVDYMVIAISPALIMLLLGSLCFFLLTALYDGQHHGRLTWVFSFFILGAVMVGRLSIDEGREYAMLFALPLAGAVSIAVIVLSDLNPIICLLLVALVWYCAHKLTWDCTVVNDRDDASGEGLLQHIGLAQSSDATEDATSSPDENTSPAGNLWQRYLARRKKAHTPGLWVVYFSMAALPMFGFGQLMIPSGDAASRSYAFRLLMVYVASALALLLTTSFLGLRRYLRQRSMEMPVEMAGGWLTLGGVLIVGLLGFCLLLPRPSPTGTLAGVISKVGSPLDLMNSPFGFGKGEQDEKNATQTQDDPNEFGDGEPSQNSSKDSQPRASNDQAQQTRSDQQGSDESQDSESNSNHSSDSNSSADQSQQSSDSSQQQSDSESSDSRSDAASDDRSQAEQNQPQNNSQNDSSNDERTSEKNEQQERETVADDDKPSRRQQSRQDESQSAQQKKTPTLPKLGNVAPVVMLVFKILLWVGMAAVAGYFLYKNWDKVVAAWKKFLRELSGFWNRLFGGQRGGTSDMVASATAAQAYRPFASFRDPFASGSVHHESPDAVVRYSFEALEASAREHGFPRGEAQTPQEFAQQVAQNAPHLGAEAIQLADLYNQAAYAGVSMPATTLPQLQALWQKLATAPPALAVR